MRSRFILLTQRLGSKLAITNLFQVAILKQQKKPIDFILNIFGAVPERPGRINVAGFATLANNRF